ncbi:MAG: DUF4416 family protein [candidate division Zixibacteria bacterium]|nr:DUF4416 family protein [candidate division Zixibacteria bacterium]
MDVKPVKLICGLIYHEIDILREVTEVMIENFGSIDNESDVFDFDHTDYYQDEMGDKLTRKFVSFEKLIQPDRLAEMKTRANQIETQFARKNNGSRGRCVNIDPGYIELSKLVLASTKNFSHRIYLDRGIYGEVTLIRKGDSFIELPWTYPDYLNPVTLEFLENVRNTYKTQLRKEVKPDIFRIPAMIFKRAKAEVSLT